MAKRALAETVKIACWNVNGIRAVLKPEKIKAGTSLQALVDEVGPSVVCLQETKIDESLVEEFKDLLNETHPHSFWHCATVKKGYSGTAVFSATEPLSVQYGLPAFDDAEGRVLTCEFPSFYLVNVYQPNSGQKLDRLSFRTEEFDPALRKHVNDLKENGHGKGVIICGDMNVAHADEDIQEGRPKSRRNKVSGFTDAERENMGLLIGGDGVIPEELRKKRTALVGRPGDMATCDGFFDAYHSLLSSGSPLLKEGTSRFTFWSYRFNAKAKDDGWRIDYFLCSPNLREKIKGYSVLDRYHGASDHVPIILSFEGSSTTGGGEKKRQKSNN
eukprot:g4492.t1